MDRSALIAATDELGRLAEGHADLARAAARLAGRTRHGRFHVAVAGDVKRGKSTLVNALLGTPVLPTGVVPLTAVATEVGHGRLGATVHLLDGGRRDIPIGELADWVTEPGNPDNRRGVDRVEVRVPAPLLATGLVLVDTPGAGSVYEHNTTAAADARALADAAIVVLGADGPLSRAERDALDGFRVRGARLFVVVNKADRLDDDELDEVLRFVAGQLGDGVPVRAVSARRALEARRAGRPPGPDAGEIGVLEGELAAFVAGDLAAERDAVTARELARLVGELGGRVALEVAAAELEAGELDGRLRAFRREARAEREAFDADQLLLRRRTHELGQTLWRRLSGAVAEIAARRRGDVVVAAEEVPAAALGRHLRGVVESIVVEEFERLRPAETAWLDRSWERLAGDLAERLAVRADAVRAAAAENFAVELPPLVAPRVTSVPDRFTYLFLRLPVGDDPVTRLAARLVPAPLRRRRAVAAAVADLDRELDRHAGRARHDLEQRLGAARQDLVGELATVLDRYVDELLGAADRGERLRRAGAAELGRRRDLLARLDELTAAIHEEDRSGHGLAR